MTAGVTLRFSSVDNHLWVILSDTSAFANAVLIANFTTWNDLKDQTCVVLASQCTGLTHKSCISYRHVKKVALHQLEALERSGLINCYTAVSPQLLRQIRRGVVDSSYTPNEIVTEATRQGFDAPSVC